MDDWTPEQQAQVDAEIEAFAALFDPDIDDDWLDEIRRDRHDPDFQRWLDGDDD